jgi:quercetin dioxygenase-like cupin family protein
VPEKHGRHEDHRGVIQDLLGPVDAVTEIVTRKGAVRGNHVHEETVQWTYIVSGSLLMRQGPDSADVIATAGNLILEPSGIPHAWKALEDTVVLVFTQGPRSGAAYESDTRRLDVPLLQEDE